MRGPLYSHGELDVMETWYNILVLYIQDAWRCQTSTEHSWLGLLVTWTAKQYMEVLYYDSENYSLESIYHNTTKQFKQYS